MPMLQDLDSLAARIEQMVKLMRQLQAERASLLARVKSLEGECNQLTERLQQRDADISAVTSSLAEHETSLKTFQARADDAQAQLQLQLDQYRQKFSITEQQLQQSQETAQRLRTVSESAREQIDSILVRLPGAAQE